MTYFPGLSLGYFHYKEYHIEMLGTEKSTDCSRSTFPKITMADIYEILLIRRGFTKGNITLKQPAHDRILGNRSHAICS